MFTKQQCVTLSGVGEEAASKGEVVGRQSENKLPHSINQALELGQCNYVCYVNKQPHLRADMLQRV